MNILWGKPFSMKYIDSMLFVYDDIAGEDIFHLVDLNHKNKVLGLGKKGQGKNEFIMPMEYLPCGDTAIAVFDYGNKKLFNLNIDDFLKQRNESDVWYKDTFPGTVNFSLQNLIHCCHLVFTTTVCFICKREMR